MILVDNTQIILSSIFSSFGDVTEFSKRTDEDIRGIVRHITLNMYLDIKKKFGGKYGKRLILCNDTANSWRKDIFPHYKAARSKQREKDAEHWEKVFNILSEIRKEIDENLDDISISVNRCEADDVIGVLATKFCQNENVLIVSNDKDFQQLLYYKNIAIYSTRSGELVNCPDPTQFLFEHIVKGDSVDGIPNILSDSDTLVVKEKRQKPITAKRLNEFIKIIPNGLINMPNDPLIRNLIYNYKRNRILIDLNYIPTDYQQTIIKEYENISDRAPRGKLFQYFIDHKLSRMMQSINEF